MKSADFFILIFLIIILLKINIVISFRFYRSFGLLSGNAILVNPDGIFYYDLTTEQKQEITLFGDSYLQYYEYNSVVFTQFSSENGYVIGFAKTAFYIIKNEQTLQCKIEVELSNVEFTIIPIKYENSPYEKITFAYAYIQSDILYLEVYEIIPQNENECIKNNIKSVNFALKNSLDETSRSSGAKPDCQLMHYSILDHDIITCFYQNASPKELATISFDIDSDYKPMNELSLMTKENTGANYITSTTNYKKTKSLVCYTDLIPYFYCIIFDLNKKEWSNYTYLYSYFQTNLYLTGAIFFTNSKEYVLYCHDHYGIKFIRLNENFQIINDSSGKNNCMVTTTISGINLYGDVLVYSNTDKSYYYISSFYDSDQIMKKEKIEDLCNSEFKGDILFYNQPLNETDNDQTDPSDNPKSNSTSSNFTNSTSSNFTNSTSSNFTNSTSSNFTNSNSSNFINSTSSNRTSSNGETIVMYLNESVGNIVNNLEELLENIEIGKVYKLPGENYEIKIKPLNYTEEKNTTTVDLKECGEILKKEYKLPANALLTILQIEIDKKNEQSLTNQVEYAVFDEEKRKLDLSYCKNVSIIVYHEIKNNSLLDTNLLKYYSEKGVDILNLEDDFFNDLCYPYSENGTDLILDDRINDIYQNYSMCDTGCEYKDIDIDSMIISCQCNVKEEVNAEIEQLNFAIAIERTFKDSNFGVIRCYGLILDFNILKSNIGFWFFMIFTVTHIPLFGYYFISGGITNMTKFVSNEMKFYNYSTKSINNPPLKKNKKKYKVRNSNILNINSSRSPVNKNNTIDKSGTRLHMIKNNINIKNKYRNKKDKQMDKFNSSKNNYNINSKNFSKKKINPSNRDLVTNYTKHFKYKQEKSTIHDIEKNNHEKYKNYCIIIKIDINEPKKKKEPYESKYILDNFEFKEAMKYEKRSFWRIILICLFYKENFLNSFIFKSPLLLKSLRIGLLIFHISCDFALNALFYFNGNISDRYNYDGESLYLYSFINNLVITVCSTLVSFLLQIFFRYLIDSKKEIRGVFRKEESKMKINKKYIPNNKDKNRVIHEIKLIFRKLRIKILIFILLEFLMMLFFWYFVSAFCAVYNGTQYSWLYDSFTSLIFSIFTKLITCFFLSLLYITSIKYRIECLYKFGIFFYELG